MAVVTLSNPLRSVYAVALGLVERDYPIGETLVVDVDVAQSIITAGYSTINPTNADAVAAALGDPTPQSTVTGGTLDAETIRDIIAAMLQPGPGVTLTKDDAADTVLIEAVGGGTGGGVDTGVAVYDSAVYDSAVYG